MASALPKIDSINYGNKKHSKEFNTTKKKIQNKLKRRASLGCEQPTVSSD